MNWQPIETAPKNGTPVLVWAPNSRGDAEGWFRRAQLGCAIASYSGIFGGGWYGDLVRFEYGWESTGSYTVDIRLEPTHWMPLPGPPPTEGDDA